MAINWPWELGLVVLLDSLRAAERVGVVIGTLAVIGGHEAVALVVFRGRIQGTVDRDLLPVDPQPVAVGVRVREEPGLKHLVRADLDARDEVGGRGGELLDLFKIVGGIFVQGHHADLKKTRKNWKVWKKLKCQKSIKNLVFACFVYLGMSKLTYNMTYFSLLLKKNFLFIMKRMLKL